MMTCFSEEGKLMAAKVRDYFRKHEDRDKSYLINMEKVGNGHIFNKTYARYHSFTVYENQWGKILFNLYVSDVDNDNDFLSILVTVNSSNIDDILCSIHEET